jgi:hypothetical protein
MFEFFDVTYFDASEVSDPKTKALFDTKMTSLKNEFET